MPHIFFNTPLGTARITETNGYISAISVLDDAPNEEEATSAVLELAVKQLAEYFSGHRTFFDFPIMQAGTPFQQTVWDELLKIEYGQTISYAQLSEKMQNPLAIRAIAAANGKNNLWIAIPCHRVIGSNGHLTGYAGGLWRKQWLLEHEAKVLGIGQTQLAF